MIKFKSPIEPGVLRTPWVYFDGSAEEIVADKIGDERDDWIPPDICGVFVGNEEPDDAIEICDRGRAILPVGEYPVLVYEEPARAFIWENDRDFVVPLIEGLIVLESDKQRVIWAREHLNAGGWR